MRTKEFLSKLEHDRIVQAIRDAESKTSGQVRVYIQRGKLDVDPLIAAQKKFHRLGMQKTPERNAILIFVAMRVVPGDPVSSLPASNGTSTGNVIEPSVSSRVETTTSSCAGNLKMRWIGPFAGSVTRRR